MLKNIKKIGAISIAAIFLAVSFMPAVPTAKAATDAVLSFDQATVSVETGDTVTLVARVNPGTNEVGAVELDVTFNPSVLQLDSITRSAAFNMTLGGPTIDNTGTEDTDGTGSIDVGLLTSPATYITTTSDVATFVFTALSTATNSPVVFAATSDASAHGEYVVLTRTPSRVTVTEPDVTPPSITATAPATSAYINSITTSSDVSYALSEAIQSGTIVFTRTGGTADATTHTCTLTGTALNTGSHSNLNLSDTTNACTAAQSLVSGTIYTVTFNATDLAGNPATQVSNTGVTFDSTAPTITSTAPATSAYINSITTSSDVSYALSEAIQSGTIVFTRTGGTADATTHTCTLTGTALNTGSHSNLNLSDTTNACTAAQSLVSGTIYTVTFNATDLAGNPATQVSNTGVTFDSTPPEAAESAAVTAIASDNTPSYTFSSTEAGTIAYSGGCTSATTAAISGSNTITFNELTRGNDYNCTVRITDAAGNQSAILNITEFAVTYRGDLDNNRAVNSNDFTTFADDYGETSWCGHTTDIDGNCIVNSNDFTILATDYGISF